MDGDRGMGASKRRLGGDGQRIKKLRKLGGDRGRGVRLRRLDIWGGRGLRRLGDDSGRGWVVVEGGKWD